MPIPVISPPEHYSADAAYRLLKPLRPALEAAQTELVTGINARRAVLHVTNIASLAERANEALQAGVIAGSPDWTATTQAALMEVMPLLVASQPIEQKYAKRVGEKIAADADTGTVTSLEDAQVATLLDQADIDTMRGLVDAALG